MVAQHVDLTTLEVDRIVMVGVTLVWFSDREHHLLKDVTQIMAPCLEVKGPSALAALGRLL
jgi:DhnA family fructose-bisphosphate aldolase class Ia